MQKCLLKKLILWSSFEWSLKTGFTVRTKVAPDWTLHVVKKEGNLGLVFK